MIMFGIFAYTNAYQATIADKQQVQQLQNTLDTVINNNIKDLWHFIDQIDTVRGRFTKDSKIGYMLEELYIHLRNQFDAQKIQAKNESIENKKNFIEEHQVYIKTGINEPDRCTPQYQLLDDLSFVYNQPTALTIATWYRETTCRRYLPGNGDGPFQILNEDYGTGELTQEIFKESVKDYLEFNQRKFDRFEKANAKSGLTIDLSYTGFTLTGIVRHGALYNSLSGKTVYGDIQPMRPWYVFDGYGEAFSGAKRYGTLPKFVQSLQRETQQRDNLARNQNQ